MKKIFYYVSFFMMLGIVGCSKDDSGDGSGGPGADPLIGEWRLDYYTYAGVNQEPDECEAMGVIKIMADGTMVSTEYWDNGNGCEFDGEYTENWENLGGGVYAFVDEFGEEFTMEPEFFDNNNRFRIVEMGGGVEYSVTYFRD
ncbi:MAG TPA: lipocalin family protein [Salinimicrobium sp.]|nr:lipocalin family protein [Salinimicrobium sp.]